VTEALEVETKQRATPAFEDCCFYHLRDPFLAIQKAASLSTDTLIITDLLQLTEDEAAATVLGQGRVARFRPDAATCWPYETWWDLSPHFVAQAVQILGFTDVQFFGPPTPVHEYRDGIIHNRRAQGSAWGTAVR
jgi:hypothetical protein